MFADLMRAVAAAVAAGVLPGYFWAAVLAPRAGLAERLTWSSVLSVASVPAVALALAKAARTGVTLWVAIGAVALVAGSGALALAARGPARGPAGPALPRPAPIRSPGVLALTLTAFAAALITVVAALLHQRVPGPLLALVALMVAVAGALAAWTAGLSQAGPPAHDGGPAPGGNPAPGPGGPGPGPPTREPALATKTALAEKSVPSATEGQRRPAWRAPALGITLALITVRGYAGVILLNWPYIRGTDQFSYVIMSEQMLRQGSYATFLTYPPGFSTLSAVICRISGLAPYTLYPVLAPALLLLTSLAAYALATRLWGWEYGIAAAALSGLVLDGAYTSFFEGRYPDLTAAFFLMMMLGAALVVLYQSPSLRSGALVTVVGASVVLYHPVVSMYLALLLALVAVIGLPYLLLRGLRREARVLLLTLAAAALLSACYAVYTYDLPGIISGSSSTSHSVAIVLGTQPVPAASHLLTELGPALVWLSLFGFAALAAAVRYLRTPSQVLTVLTLLGWCAVMYAGSRTAADGFPTRFERDLGAPLSVTAAFGAGLLLRSLPRARLVRKTAAAALAAVGAAVVGAMLVIPSVANVATDSRTRGNVLGPRVAAAARWLREHNTGGTIITTPWMKPVSNRAVLAMGGYTGLQSYTVAKIEHPRSLPPAGRQPLLDSHQVLWKPASCQSARALSRNDVRYVVLYKFGHGANLAAFQADPARYHRVYENEAVIIYSAAHIPCQGQGDGTHLNPGPITVKPDSCGYKAAV
ncbi:MAG TPA: hypothetical protein VF256_23635 [Streptosporangiaceae bacterium]